MKRIVVCFDGTWNKPADEKVPSSERVETNVRRFYGAVHDTGTDGIRQLRWYDQGVGTEWYSRFAAGAIGAGLELNIIEGYRFLAENYQDGDAIYLLGFSRGAYTARSLAGMIRNCGLIHATFVALKVGIAYGIYRTRDDGPDSLTARLFRAAFSREVKIKFLGVWDTVGALGIPLDILQAFNMKFYEFHDTRLSGIIENAYQAVAVDEHRKDYNVCLWDPAAVAQRKLEQRWFIGSHSDVGGGYPDRRLSDIALRWIQDKAAESGLSQSLIELGPENHLGKVVDSYRDFLQGLYARRHPRHYRSIGTTQFGNEVVDESVERRRRKKPGYKPRNKGLPKPHRS